MSAGNLPISIEQGATWDYELTIYEYDANNPPTYEGDITDLSGFSARAQIRKKKSSTSAQLEMTTENGMIALGGVLGTVTLHIPAVNTAGLNFNTGVWDLELYQTVDDEEIVYREVEGVVTLSKEVTKEDE